MTIGKIYYLATICGKLYGFLFFMKFPLTIGAGIAVACYVAIKMDAFTDEDFFEKEVALAQKCTKWTVIPLMVVATLSMFVPTKEDFLIITMTKNYTPEQVYTMTKDELKNSIDYFVNQIEEIKK